MMRAYFEAPRISVLADYPCYHWVLRDRDVNASWGRLDPPTYFAFMGEVLDVIDAHTEPGPFRDRLYARWYRGRCSTASRRSTPTRTSAIRRALYETMHELAVARFPESVDAFLPFNLQRALAAAARGRLDALAALADTETALRAQARAPSRCGRPGGAELRLEAELDGLRFTRDGDRLLWGGARTRRTGARRQHGAAAAQAARQPGGVPRAGRGHDAARRRRRRGCARC